MNVQRSYGPQNRAGATNGEKMNGDTLLTQTGDSAALPAPADPWDGMPPGSDNALDWGCTCPVIENRGGRGCWAFEGEMHYWMAETCPLHGFTVQEASDD